MTIVVLGLVNRFVHGRVPSAVYVFLVLITIFHFDPERFISKNCKYKFYYQECVYLGENTTILVIKLTTVNPLALQIRHCFWQ